MLPRSIDMASVRAYRVGGIIVTAKCFEIESDIAFIGAWELMVLSIKLATGSQSIETPATPG